MSKYLEFDTILNEKLKEIYFIQPDQTYNLVLDAMVAAYNKGLEDAINEIGWVDRDTNVSALESLKIK